MSNTTILITGATGFVGSHILEAIVLNSEILNKDIKVIVACRDPSKLPAAFNLKTSIGSRKPPQALGAPGKPISYESFSRPNEVFRFKGEVRAGDLSDSGYLRDVVQGVDIVCHAAAWTSLWAHRQEEQQYYREPSTALIDAAIQAGVKRFIFDSSVVVTGPHRSRSAIADHEAAQKPGFWPHMDIVVDIENYMRERAQQGTTMVSLRCGHFAGARYNLGLLSLLVPRLKSHLVPWVAGGNARVPLVDGRDIGNAFVLAALADELEGFESFNICGPSFPSMREVVDFLHTEIGIPKPHFGVPLWGAYAFGWLMEKLSPLFKDPFLTRSIVFLGEDWYAPSDLAKQRLGYEPKYTWKEALRQQLKDMERQKFRRIPLVDKIETSH